MRTLIISAYPPSTAEDSSHGIFKRLENFGEAFCAEGEVDCLFFSGNESDVTPAARELIEVACRKRWGGPVRVFLGHKGRKSARPSFASRYLRPMLSVSAQPNFDDFAGPAQIADLETCLARRPDLVFAHRLEAMLLIMAAGRPVPPVLYDIDDVEHVKFMRFMRQPPFWLGKIVLYLLWPILFWTERRAIRAARTAFVCSAADQAYLQRKWGLRNIEVVSNAVRIPAASAVPLAPIVLFLGNYGYGPNCSAAEFLANEIWPKVRLSVPEARLVLAGRGAERLHLPEHRPGIEVRGFVADLDALYGEVRVVACPILAGGGTRFKIIEAAAYGRPIVSTTLGAEGIPLVDPQEIVHADTSDEFASACVDLLRNHEKCAAMAAKSRAKAVLLYDRNCIMERVRGIARSASGRRA